MGDATTALFTSSRIRLPPGRRVEGQPESLSHCKQPARGVESGACGSPHHSSSSRSGSTRSRLRAEIAQFADSEWRPHPQGTPGIRRCPLIAHRGNPLDDGVAGPMRPTPNLARCPYVQQLLAALDAPLGRTRLMKLDAGAEVTPHVDVAYYWQQRVRVHVPVVTFPEVAFLCGDATTHMTEGECWVFDTWRMHNVLNPTNRERIHLVSDTVGSEAFWRLAATAARRRARCRLCPTPDQRCDSSRPITLS